MPSWRTSTIAGRPSRRERGFTVLELLVGVLITAVMILAALALFDSTTQVTRSTLHRLDLHQSSRIAQREVVRMVRLAGRGGLPAGSESAPLPAGWAVRIDNNVRDRSVIDAPGAPSVVDGTDVLTVRGVVSTPVYLLDPFDPQASRIYVDRKGGRLVVRETLGALSQDLEPLREMLTEGARRPEALILVSAFDDRVFGVAEVDYSRSNAGASDRITLGFRYAGSLHADRYAELSSDGVDAGAFPEDVFSRVPVGTVGILEEHRFYVREDRLSAEPDQILSSLGKTVRRLSRARTYPNVSAAYADTISNLRIDIADNVIDFQVALAFDRDGDGLILEKPDGTGDEWLGNSSSDDPSAHSWRMLLAGSAPPLRFARVTTLARAAEPDRRFRAKEVDRLEDHEYGHEDPLNSDDVLRQHPRFVLRTAVEMRNL